MKKGLIKTFVTFHHHCLVCPALIAIRKSLPPDNMKPTIMRASFLKEINVFE